MSGAPVPPVPSQPLQIVRSEADILSLALAVAARKGDPNPRLVQHTTGPREAATRTTGSVVFANDPSYLIAITGTFRARRPTPPGIHLADADAFITYTIQVLVVDIATGRVTDIGSTQIHPDLATVGPVTTDYSVDSESQPRSWSTIPQRPSGWGR